MKVIITIKHGMIEVVKLPKNIDVEIHDYDIDGCDPTELHKDEDGGLYLKRVV